MSGFHLDLRCIWYCARFIAHLCGRLLHRNTRISRESHVRVMVSCVLFTCCSRPCSWRQRWLPLLCLNCCCVVRLTQVATVIIKEMISKFDSYPSFALRNKLCEEQWGVLVKTGSQKVNSVGFCIKREVSYVLCVRFIFTARTYVRDKKKVKEKVARIT